ncbi:hypothetical protein [Nocardia farcinica]|uniref:hypothetical protein n=1 Tax=Nocardia farcinica TaxID=37329 RepID=UPI000DFC97F4|nr:hypothetical protein [Nocardia farcinica]MBF6254469.1 hypothetical protein [Nocardia farcinica]MBF6445503.1 hypothetical protein [Nocardia farcinica]MBF6523330.1 hypothetical protein [Nocardia farcinica]SUE27760.1 Uncharacterised protein [Nocardia farcinica]
MSEFLDPAADFPDLFRGLDPGIVQAVVRVLTFHRLDGMAITREIVADTIGFVTGAVSEADYDRRAAQRATVADE